MIKCLGVPDGKIREDLALMLGGVAALGHHRHDQQLRLGHGARWRVHESFLNVSPLASAFRVRGGI